MPAPLLNMLVSIPWSMLLKRAPALVKTADALLSGTLSRREERTTPDEVGFLKERVAALEAHDQRDAELVKQLAEQVQALTLTIRIMAAREKALLWISAIGFWLVLIAVVFYFLMSR